MPWPCVALERIYIYLSVPEVSIEAQAWGSVPFILTRTQGERLTAPYWDEVEQNLLCGLVLDANELQRCCEPGRSFSFFLFAQFKCWYNGSEQQFMEKSFFSGQVSKQACEILKNATPIVEKSFVSSKQRIINNLSPPLIVPIVWCPQ